MSGFHINIEQKTLENENFREVLYTAPHSQLVVMSIEPGEDIGVETHDKVDQFLRIEAGVGKAIIDGEEFELKDGMAIVVPAGSQHNFVNTSETEKLKLYTIYSPANHPDGKIHRTRAEAVADEEDHV